MIVLTWALTALAQQELDTHALARRAAKAEAPAVEEMERRANRGEALAQHYMGMLAVSGRGTKGPDDAEALQWFQRAAEAGHVESAHNVAVIRERNTGTLRDGAEALRWYRHAAERGYARSQANLGRLLLRGEGDATEGRTWLEKAAAQSDPVGMLELGLLHVEGKGVAQDQARGAALVRKAAELGEREAYYHLGLLYGTGRGLPKDADAGLQWMRKAADARHPEAQYFLAAVLTRGLYGRKRDFKQAAEWLRRAGAQGHVNAQYELGLAYSEGRGVPRNPTEALGWLRAAARGGHAEASIIVTRIESEAARKREASDKKD